MVAAWLLRQYIELYLSQAVDCLGQRKDSHGYWRANKCTQRTIHFFAIKKVTVFNALLDWVYRSGHCIDGL